MRPPDTLHGISTTGEVQADLEQLSIAAGLAKPSFTLLPIPDGPYLISPAESPPPLELSLILPTFNEARNIKTTLHTVWGILNSIQGLSFEIIVVDDNSPDGTWQLALDEAAVLPGVQVMRRTKEAGLATAVIRGWQASQGSILAVMDSDLQHPPGVLVQLVKAIKDGADLAAGSRHVEEGGVSDWSPFRRIISRTAQLIGLAILPEVVGRVADPMSGYFMLTRASIAGKLLNPTGYKILIEVLARGSLTRIKEIGYVFCERKEGESKVSATIYLQYLEHLLRLRIDLLKKELLKHSQFVRFCLVGSSGVVIDMLILFLLSDPSTLGWGLTRSKILSAEGAMVNNFLWNDAWTFADMEKIGASKFQRFLRFNGVCLVGVVINLILINIQFNWFGVNRYLANATSIVATTFWNYFMNKRLGWKA